MEDWQREFEFLRIRHWVKETLDLEKIPDLQAILIMVGIQELGLVKENFTKEEKQDLMHIAVCRLLSYDGYYELEGYDEEGWPHWNLIKPVPFTGVENQEKLLQEKLFQYFENLEKENN